MTTPQLPLLLGLFFTSSSFLCGQTREWKNTDGSKSIVATFVSRDTETITLKRSTGETLTFPVTRLHESELTYLDDNHPLETGGGTEQGNAFGPLSFGDSRAEVEEKLLQSSFVKTKVDRGLFGRTGLNGIFETAQSIGDLPCFLYFDWDTAGGLREVTLRTKDEAVGSYRSKLHPTWTELIELLAKLYGNPLSKSPFPEANKLEMGSIIGTHLWRTGEGHSVFLGPARSMDGYNVSVRITTERIEPVPVP
ncbi:hypothetical protein [Roseibacillus ishigakijimensis]|uniref:SLA1 homology domain-containing protein n=1 Tax=Roseibacillus ishigakijimensis TaxID=454146 RepID=A0A934RL94_9BACT|nr:hypothetical protein [Roseibacillus ishigakijimensis]MBK1833797.1 hypothetical protein [Roseibacillus ishigakijimensis]